MGGMFHPFLFGGTMNWYVVDKEYVKHLSQSDSRVGYVEYGDRLKLHVGILLRVNETNYYVPVSSPKPKQHKNSLYVTPYYSSVFSTRWNE